MDNVDLFNIYVEKLANEVTELTKNRILMSAQLAYYEKQILALSSQLQEANTQLEKLNKKNSKKDTTETF